MPERAMVPLPGSERQEQPGAARIGPVPDDETIQFSVVVRARQGAPDMEEVARNASLTGEFLSREELAAATAPDPADVQAVEEYAHRNGLTVEGADPVTRRVKLAGSAAVVKQAFGVSLDSYQVYIRGQNASFTGTSAATPLWAGLFARVNQGIGARAGLPLATLYGPLLTAGGLNDITTGDNGAYTAGPGWDACTGLGSPNGTAILTGWRTARQVAPTVTGLSESSGSAGDQLVVTGTGFLGATAVNFGTVTAGLPAPASDTQITVAVPSGPASGTTVDVTATAPGGTSADVSADQFTFNEGAAQ